MCLNCLPYYEKCLFCIHLRAAVILISIINLIITICLILLSYLHSIALDIDSKVNYNLWFLCNILFLFIPNILLITVWSGIVKNEDARDILLQVYFWLNIAFGVLHLIFCLALLIFCWKTCLIIVIIYISVTVIVFCVMAYLLLIVNSYRMSLF